LTKRFFLPFGIFTAEGYFFKLMKDDFVVFWENVDKITTICYHKKGCGCAE